MAATTAREDQMSHSNDGADAGQPLVGNRTMDIVVSLLFIGLAAVFMTDSWRIGIGWIEGQGPASGFFPFYISLFMALASVVNLQRALTHAEADGAETFVGAGEMVRVLMVLIPTILYVVAIQYLGIYVSSAIFISLFLAVSRAPVWQIAFVGIGVALALFFMFERWFLVPLPKGPLEAYLGF
jgi:putative tricarboxylic transport membrane protein